MPSASSHPSMNTRVEGVDDAFAQNGNSLSSNPNGQFSWPEIFARHDSALSSHLEILNSVKEHVQGDDATRALNSMIEKTERLVVQFRVVKKQLNKTNPFKAMSSGDAQCTHSNSANSNTTGRAKMGKKRSRTESEPEATMDTGTGTGTEDAEALSIPKRKRRDTSIPGGKEDVRNATPVSLETEDISEEVHQRLMIREERRKRRSSKAEKRKRESFVSNESAELPGESGRPRRKKAKVRSAEEGGRANGETATKTKRRGSDGFDSGTGNARDSKRFKNDSAGGFVAP